MMSLGKDIINDNVGFDDESMFASIQVIEKGFVVNKTYCKKCKSTNIKMSGKGNIYCGNLCWITKEDADIGIEDHDQTFMEHYNEIKM